MKKPGDFRIPRVVLEHMDGAEVYVASDFYGRNHLEVRQRAIEDAKFLIDINFDGYEDHARSAARVRTFITKAEQFEKGEGPC